MKFHRIAAFVQFVGSFLVSARNKIITSRFFYLRFFTLSSPFSASTRLYSRSRRASLLFACRLRIFYFLSFRDGSAMYPTYLPHVLPRSGKHLNVLPLRFDGVYFLLSVYLSIRTTPMRLKLHYVPR